MGKGYLIVEGHGDRQAALKLVHRIWADLGLSYVHWDDHPIRGVGLHTRMGVMKACELLRSKRQCERALLLRDEDDLCPKDRGPETAAWVKELHLPFPVAVVLPYREFETWFLPCIHLMAGKPLISGRIERPGLMEGTSFDGDVESIRGVKEWLSKHFAGGKAYKPTLDQLPMTQMLDLPTLRAANVPSFGTFERALRFLSTAGPGEVYPPPPPVAG
ncbi:DUF4276 family protein [Archangium sp.]|uniref:DUF4276 family protein n=1 Tax=Archangium sp. TaxID=1872627 RepID=UPI002D4B0D85|nr:DUF4276 family protein [Archangium sp.]HYO57436.1 DUF4276 family protein [Archangium sp.]